MQQHEFHFSELFQRDYVGEDKDEFKFEEQLV